MLDLLIAAAFVIPIETECRPVADLEPTASEGTASGVAWPESSTGEVLRWEATVGAVLRLKFRVPQSGTYSLALRAVHGPDQPAFSAQLWELPMTNSKETRIGLSCGAPDELRPVRFDPVSLGPGHHFLELTCADAGAFLLDCLEMSRTGPMTPRSADDAARHGAPFLGIEMGNPSALGVTIRRVVPESGAGAADLRAGDIIVRLDGELTSAPADVSAAINRHRPGDQVRLSLLRRGEPVEVVATLGRRIDTPLRRDQAANVLDVLDAAAGETVADLGCGSGWLSEAIAEVVGDEGLVYAVEIQDDHIWRMRRTARANIMPVLSAPDDICLPEDSLDTAMLHDVASHVAKSARPRFYESVERALKPEGKLVIFGPHGKARAMLDDLREYGLVAVNADELDALPDDELDRHLDAGIVFCFR